MANISKTERERRLALSDEELTAEGLTRPKVRNSAGRGAVVVGDIATVDTGSKAVSKYKLAERAVKKLRSIFGRENAAIEKATSGVRERFQIKKDVVYDTLSPEVRALVDADLSTVSAVTYAECEADDSQNPDVSDNDNDLDEAANG